MSADVLSQEEVDALLKGVSGEAEPEAGAEESDGPRTYDLASQERIVRGRMPTLEIINERFARFLRVGMFNLMRRTPEITVGPVKVQKYAEFLRNLVVPTNLNIMQLRTLRGNGLFVFEPNLVFSVVDNMFGGDGRFHTRVEGREFTATESRIVQKILQTVRDEYQKSWAPVHPLEFEYVRSEMHTQFANIATPSEVVVVSTFGVEIGSTGGNIHICFPYSAIEPIRDLLAGSTQGDRTEPDRRWMSMLSRQVQLAEVNLVATFAQIPATVKQLLSIKAGDVMFLERQSNIIAKMDGVPMLECQCGTSNGHYAIRVNRILAIPPQDNMLGDSNDRQ
jgi:flagellar motor switch protein FliM